MGNCYLIKHGNYFLSEEEKENIRNFTWRANSTVDDGYVVKTEGEAYKVYGTDAEGNPIWRDDSIKNLTATAHDLDADAAPTIDVTISDLNASLDFGIPRGKQGETGADGAAGPAGESGATFTPFLDEDGTLSWTNDKSLPNPESVNIRGPVGPIGPTGIQGKVGPAGPNNLSASTTTTELDGLIKAADNKVANAVANVDYVAPSRTINGKALTDDIVLNAEDVGALGAEDNAVSATKDSAGNDINATYIKDITIVGTTMTVKRGDDTTFTRTTQDTTYKQATDTELGLVKLYAATGATADGTMTQQAITTALAGKANVDEITEADITAIFTEVFDS